jgi:hypothetical protein
MGTGLPHNTGWTAARLGSRRLAEWSADDHGTALMTDAGAGVISSWIDSAAAITCTGATTARPTWSATGFDTGKAAVVFDGTANALTATVLTGIPVGAEASEIWLLLNETSGDGVLRIAVGYGDISVQTFRRIGKTAASFYSVSDGSAVNTDTVIASAGRHIVGGRFLPTIYLGRIDGRPFTPASSPAAAPNTGAVRLRLGAATGTSPAAFFKGGLRRAVITQALTANERFQMEGWMAWDAALPTLLPDSHPFRYSPP